MHLLLLQTDLCIQCNLHKQQIFILCHGNTHNTVQQEIQNFNGKPQYLCRRNFWRINCNLNCIYSVHVVKLHEVWIMLKTNHTMEVRLLGYQNIWAPLFMNSNVDVIVFIYIFEDSMVPSKLKFPAIQNPGIYVVHNTVYIHRIITIITRQSHKYIIYTKYLHILLYGRTKLNICFWSSLPS